MTTPIEEAFRIMQASERLSAVGLHLAATTQGIDRVLEVAGDVEPEVEQIKQRVLEIIEHVEAAFRVLGVKLDLASATGEDSTGNTKKEED